MDIQVFELPPIQTNAYLVSDSAAKKAILIDAPLNAWKTVQPVLEAGKLNLEAVLLTHGHFDHIMGASVFKEKGIPVLGSEKDQPFFKNLSPQLEHFGLAAQDVQFTLDKILKDGIHSFLNQTLEVRSTPGHSPGSLMFYFAKDNVAFVGDAIFAGSVGRTDLPGGSIDTLLRSIREKIYTLPETTTLYPGHGAKTDVLSEKQSNPIARPE